MLTSADVKARARQLGFDLCGVAPAALLPELDFLATWLARGYAGEMTYMARTATRRADIRAVLASARSVIVTGTLYNTERPRSVDNPDPSTASVSRYGWGDDYHDIIAPRQEQLIEWIRARSGEPIEARAWVDTGPVQEKVYARHAGLGWIGKNTCLISPTVGSWVFLGVVGCSLALVPDEPGLERCGRCTLCLEACPSGALVEPGVLDATRCLSYLTIELRGAIAPDLRHRLGHHVFGCDLCQDVCPWNAGAPVSQAATWQPREGLDGAPLATLWRQSDEGLRALVAGTPITRPGIVGLRRNLAVAIGNSGNRDALAALSDTPGDDGRSRSTSTPLVREHVAWALARGAT